MSPYFVSYTPLQVFLYHVTLNGLGSSEEFLDYVYVYIMI